MKLRLKLLIIALIIFITFFSTVYVSNLKSYTYFKSPNKITLYKNGNKKTYTRFSFKYRKILKALNARYDENSDSPMTAYSYKDDLNTMKDKGAVLVLEYNKIQTSIFKINYEKSKTKYCRIYFPLDVYHETQAIYLLDRENINDKLLRCKVIKGLYSIEGLNKVLK